MTQEQTQGISRLRIRIVLRTLALGGLVTLFASQVPLVSLWALDSVSLPDSSLTDALRVMVLGSFGFSAVLAVILSVWMGLNWAVSVCGQVYAVRRFFEQLTVGRWDRRCTFRKGDELHDLKDAINAFVSTACERVEQQHDVIREAEALLGQLRDDSGVAGVNELLERIASERAEYERRLGSGSPERARPEKQGVPA